MNTKNPSPCSPVQSLPYLEKRISVVLRVPDIVNLEIVNSIFSKTINLETEKIDYVQESCNIVFLCTSLSVNSLQLATQKSSGWRSTPRHLSKGKIPSCSCGWWRRWKRKKLLEIVRKWGLEVFRQTSKKKKNCLVQRDIHNIS